ncbi:hypothetical protein ACIBEA_20060 [Streptomyces sp. NPDC051555]|uniref:hypothetical protein n=1 Tax=Streptomyces sp. NPDC051555 TaxID=3365657 RepID=UPI00379D85DB
MRTYRTTAASAVGALTVVLVLALGGCTSTGPAGPAPGPGSSSAAPTPIPTPTPTAAPGTTGSGSAAPTAPGTPTGHVTPSRAAQQLLRVTRSGGFAGHRSSLDVLDDGSWTLLDGSAKPVGTGKLTAARLDGLRAAVRQVDFAHPPPSATGGATVYDGFTYAFTHDGHEVVAADGAIPPSLRKVLEALPSFDPSSPPGD